MFSCFYRGREQTFSSLIVSWSFSFVSLSCCASLLNSAKTRTASLMIIALSDFGGLPGSRTEPNSKNLDVNKTNQAPENARFFIFFFSHISQTITWNQSVHLDLWRGRESTYHSIFPYAFSRDMLYLTWEQRLAHLFPCERIRRIENRTLWN